MPIVPHTPAGVFPPYRGYVHAAEVVQGTRLLFISGLNGFEEDGKTMPDPFEEQAELIWQHLRTILAAAGMQVTPTASCYAPISPTRSTTKQTRGCVKSSWARIAWRPPLSAVGCWILDGSSRSKPLPPRSRPGCRRRKDTATEASDGAARDG
jgi:hypothetical protein